MSEWSPTEAARIAEWVRTESPRLFKKLTKSVKAYNKTHPRDAIDLDDAIMVNLIAAGVIEKCGICGGFQTKKTRHAH